MCWYHCPTGTVVLLFYMYLPCVSKVLLKIDLSREDIPGGEDFVGVLLTLANLGVPVRTLSPARTQLRTYCESNGLSDLQHCVRCQRLPSA